MHPRLRRQLEAISKEVPAEFIEAVDAAYRKADKERAFMESSLANLTALLRRSQGKDAAWSAREAVLRQKAIRSARRVARVLEKSGTAVLDLDPQLTVRSANPAAVKLCGADPVGKGVFALIEPLDAEAVAAKWRQKLEHGEPVAQTMACSVGERRAMACDWVCVPRLRRDGKLAGITVLVRDETERVEAQEALREREEQLGLALAGTSDVLWDWDLRAGKLNLSVRWRQLVGASPSATSNPSEWLDRVHPEDTVSLRAALAAHFEGRTETLDHEHRMRRADGEWRWIAMRGAAMRDASGAAVRAVGLMTDVTRYRQLIDRMAHDARHDALTRLPNRTLFLDLLRHSFNRTRRHSDYRFGVLFIDIDRFKAVNDAFGHEAGDDLLAQIARRLESCLREGDTLARHGGDEFTMWLDDVRGSADAVRVADRVHEVMREPFDLGGQRVQSSTSIGVAVGSATYKAAEEVLRDADVAMYRAKALGKGRTAVFQREAGGEPSPQLVAETDLRGALLRNELRVLYMPIVEVATGKVQGLEALARWQHPRLGLVAPAKFLELATETGLIISIDRWVLLTASRQLHEWRRELGDLERLTISVNMSQKLLEQQDLPVQIDRMLREAQIEPGDLNLDINEISYGPDNHLAALHQRGLGLHMDDFGIGQQWLRHLYSDEVDSVKIDRSFITASAGADRQVLKRIVSIARDLGKKVIAEGVETAEQLKYVREVGCDSAQGYFFTTPIDGGDASSLLKTSHIAGREN